VAAPRIASEVSTSVVRVNAVMPVMLFMPVAAAVARIFRTAQDSLISIVRHRTVRASDQPGMR
jgi:hypothetical protein